MRVAIDASELFSRIPGGGGQGCVVRTLIRGLARLDRKNEYTLYSLRKVRDVSNRLGDLPSNFRLVEIPPAIPQLTLAAWHLLGWPPIEWYIGNHDVVHATTTNFVPSCRRARVVLTVHDLIWWRFPRGLKPWGRYFIRKGLLIGAKHATAVTTVSDCTRNDLLEYLDGKLMPDKVRRIYNGIDPQRSAARNSHETVSPAERHGIPGHYVLGLGTIEPRKNFGRVLMAYARLEPSLRRQYKLVIVGPHGWKMPPVQKLITALSLEGSVIWTGYVSDRERDAILEGASVLVYPSLYEGFGLPIVEAMRLGVPVITSNVSSMPEVAGEAALLVEPTDVEDLSSALARVLQDGELRKTLISRGRVRWQQFSGNQMASEFLGLYQSVAV